ncbi:uncharacterized protein LOC108908129 [Anoplophora glabripennis]|uniref:uncharacterized protein LOC108908129 n=1 Tax=Anoplophora glabripennis TaxID=217634 RepID=UPI000873BBB7|nr:uncharacterized protein LOC108908129 [Anoplophora glabripennis]
MNVRQGGVWTTTSTRYFLFLLDTISQGFTFDEPLILEYREEKLYETVLKMKQLLIVALVLVLFTFYVEAALQPRAPNFQYFERPKYRYPYYDENGVGRLLYGYGDDKLYQYKLFSPLEGIH